MPIPDHVPARRYVTVKDAAAYVSVDIKTIRRHIASGQLTGYRIGRAIRIDLEELERNMRPILPGV
ncbi:helix-turn-helix domain-containing protein [Nocardioides sp. NPDC006303]|uniref:helix-turn-helix domain-containing protein n=1 Tax=Nocardioides sp. NPDC006303 TaxID=3156747 RepID=UPI0033ACAC37